MHTSCHRYLGNLTASFDAAGQRLNISGQPILLGPAGSGQPVAKDPAMMELILAMGDNVTASAGQKVGAAGCCACTGVLQASAGGGFICVCGGGGRRSSTAAARVSV